jgi:hypothetical protein
MNVRAWLERVDPGTHRRIKGLRLVTAYGIAWMMGTLEGRSIQLPGHNSLSALAAGFALWVSVIGPVEISSCSSLPPSAGRHDDGSCPDTGESRPSWSRSTLVIGAFRVAYLKPVGILAAGLGSHSISDSSWRMALDRPRTASQWLLSQD